MSTIIAEGRVEPESFIGQDGNVPADVLENSFKMLKPTGEISGYVNLWDNLWNDEYVESYQAINEWGHDQIPFAGAAFCEMVHVLGRNNALVSGVIPLGVERCVWPTSRARSCPSSARRTTSSLPAAAKGLPDLVGSADRHELRLTSGHVGLFVGKTAHKATLPRLCDWIEAHSDRLSTAPNPGADRPTEERGKRCTSESGRLF